MKITGDPQRIIENWKKEGYQVVVVTKDEHGDVEDIRPGHLKEIRIGSPLLFFNLTSEDAINALRAVRA